jgi:hypothetical protein
MDGVQFGSIGESVMKNSTTINREKILQALVISLVITAIFGINSALASYSSEVLADNPIGYWQLDETFGYTATDASGNNRHGTYVGGVTFATSGAITNGTSVTFDGSTGYVSLPGTWGGTAAVTIEAWVNPSVATGIQAIVSSNNSGQFCHFQLSETQANTGCYGPHPGFVLEAPFTAPINTWRHIVMTLGYGNASLYIDGNLIQSGAMTTTNNTSSSVVSIARGFLGTRHFNGALDEVAIYDDVLSHSRILAHYDAGITPPEPTEQIAGLINLTIQFNLQNGISNALDSKLDNALKSLEDTNTNNDVSAINTLQAFINGVEAQAGNKISLEDAAILIAEAEAIIEQLGGP